MKLVADVVSPACTLNMVIISTFPISDISSSFSRVSTILPHHLPQSAPSATENTTPIRTCHSPTHQQGRYGTENTMTYPGFCNAL